MTKESINLSDWDRYLLEDRVTPYFDQLLALEKARAEQKNSFSSSDTETASRERGAKACKEARAWGEKFEKYLLEHPEILAHLE